MDTKGRKGNQIEDVQKALSKTKPQKRVEKNYTTTIACLAGSIRRHFYKELHISYISVKFVLGKIMNRGDFTRSPCTFLPKNIHELRHGDCINLRTLARVKSQRQHLLSKNNFTITSDIIVMQAGSTVHNNTQCWIRVDVGRTKSQYQLFSEYF